MWLLLFNYKWVFLAFIVVMMILKDCVISPTDELDVGYPLYRYVGEIIVTDSVDNGFVVDLITTEQVTEKRLECMKERSDFTRFKERVNIESQSDRLDLLNMGVYAFLDWVLSKGLPKDIRINGITGLGHQKHLLYLQSNPNDSTYITNVPLSSNQGIIFINNIDIKNHINGYESDVYRYIDCLENSNIDERFSHISSITPLQR